MTPTYDRACPICGYIFTTDDVRRVYCSDECREKEERLHDCDSIGSLIKIDNAQ